MRLAVHEENACLRKRGGEPEPSDHKVGMTLVEEVGGRQIE